jgi:uncharacterized RDD family membrane protein YckC
VILVVVVSIIDIPINAARAATITLHTHTSATGITTYHVDHFSLLGPVIGVALIILYGAVFCGSARGQTLGMMAGKARAVDAATGGPIGFGRALGRAAFEYLLFIVLFVPWVIDMLFPAWDAKRQTLHDKVTGTVVVRI